MARVVGPLQSFEASGKLAGSIVYSRWKGRPYVRQLVTPANPKSAGQVAMRAMMRFLATQWAGLATVDQATWDELAATGNYSPFNAFTSANQRRWANYSMPSQAYPPTEALTPPDVPTLAVSAGVRDVTVTLGDTTLNDGWGAVVYRSTSMGFTPALSNAIYLIAYNGTNDVTFVDGPLEAGTYYYNATPFTTDGYLDSAIGEESAVIT